MAEYVNKQDLLERINAEMPMKCTEDNGDFYFQWRLDKSLIEEMESIKIVHCKGCKYSRKPKREERKHLMKGAVICTYDQNNTTTVHPSHFCGYGKSR